MTNTVSPCTVCGTVPEVDAQFDDECKPRCGHIRSPVATILIDDWTHSCNYELGRACRELGIETVEKLNARLAPDPRVAVLEKKLAKLTDKLAMVEQESEQRLSAIIGYSDQLLAMKEKYEPVPQSGPHPDRCFSSDPNDVADCESDGHYSCKDCKRNSLIAAQRAEGTQ